MHIKYGIEAILINQTQLQSKPLGNMYVKFSRYKPGQALGFPGG